MLTIAFVAKFAGIVSGYLMNPDTISKCHVMTSISYLYHWTQLFPQKNLGETKKNYHSRLSQTYSIKVLLTRDKEPS